MTSDETTHKAARVIGSVMSRWDMDGRPDVDGGIDVYLARALAESGLLAPAPLREEWAAIDDDGTVLMRYGTDSHSPHREYGTSLTYSRWASDWKRYGAEGDGRDEQ